MSHIEIVIKMFHFDMSRSGDNIVSYELLLEWYFFRGCKHYIFLFSKIHSTGSHIEMVIEMFHFYMSHSGDNIVSYELLLEWYFFRWCKHSFPPFFKNIYRVSHIEMINFNMIHTGDNIVSYELYWNDTFSVSILFPFIFHQSQCGNGIVLTYCEKKLF